jgi:hypothetical protein
VLPSSHSILPSSQSITLSSPHSTTQHWDIITTTWAFHRYFYEVGKNLDIIKVCLRAVCPSLSTHSLTSSSASSPLYASLVFSHLFSLSSRWCFS